jgi:hypothetical protein
MHPYQSYSDLLLIGITLTLSAVLSAVYLFIQCTATHPLIAE